MPIDPMSALLQQSTIGLNYKTILCKNFTTMGVCKYGTSCHFAHGESDIKKPVFFSIFNERNKPLLSSMLKAKPL